MVGEVLVEGGAERAGLCGFLPARIVVLLLLVTMDFNAGFRDFSFAEDFLFDHQPVQHRPRLGLRQIELHHDVVKRRRALLGKVPPQAPHLSGRHDPPLTRHHPVQNEVDADLPVALGMAPVGMLFPGPHGAPALPATAILRRFEHAPYMSAFQALNPSVRKLLHPDFGQGRRKGEVSSHGVHSDRLLWNLQLCATTLGYQSDPESGMPIAHDTPRFVARYPMKAFVIHTVCGAIIRLQCDRTVRKTPASGSNWTPPAFRSRNA